MVLDTTSLENRCNDLQSQAEELFTLLQAHIRNNASVAQDQVEYGAKYTDLSNRLDAVNAAIAKNTAILDEKKTRRYEIEAYIDTLEQSGDLLTEFDPLVWNFAIDHMAVRQNGEMVFRFKGGIEHVYR